ncbi:MAG: hypothetical protein EON95_18240 [Caulobacteraceae bacterium]|nr:hypothetical protein [Caulobacter sp.]RYF89756.1 MAG: hypothetical protein EON95_18240 [Caulobacteraceae bacterium]
MTDLKAQTWNVATDLSANHFSGVAVSLVDLHRARLLKGEALLSGVTFENCRIEGPAVMLVVGGCSFDATDFGYSGGDIRSLVLRPASPTGVVGAIPVSDCSFTGCQMFAIGYTGAEAFLAQILALGSEPK